MTEQSKYKTSTFQQQERDKVVNYIRRVCEKTGMNIFNLSEAIGMHHGALDKLVKGQTKTVQASTIAALADLSEIEYVSDGHAIVSIPIRGQISAGGLMEALEQDLGTVDVSVYGSTVGLYALVVKGDSMDRTIPDGSTVVFRKFEDDPKLADGEIVHAENDGEATVKRYDHNTKTLLPECFSTEHRPISLFKDPLTLAWTIEGVAIGVYTPLSKKRCD